MNARTTKKYASLNSQITQARQVRGVLRLRYSRPYLVKRRACSLPTAPAHTQQNLQCIIAGMQGDHLVFSGKTRLGHVQQQVCSNMLYNCWQTVSHRRQQACIHSTRQQHLAVNKQATIVTAAPQIQPRPPSQAPHKCCQLPTTFTATCMGVRPSCTAALPSP